MFSHTINRRLSRWFAPLRCSRLEDRTVPAVIAWDGGPAGTGTEWTVAANWVGDVLPGSSDEVQIGAAFSAANITHSTGVSTIQRVTSEAAITVTGGTLTLSNGSSTLNGTSAFNKTLTVANGGTLELQGGKSTTPSVTANGAIAVQGMLLAHGSSAVGGPLTTAATSVIRLQGTLQFEVARLKVANGFTNLGTIQLTDTTMLGGLYGADLTVTNGTLVNDALATITTAVGGNGDMFLHVELNNQGNLIVGKSLNLGRLTTQHVNTGKIDVTGGDLFLQLLNPTDNFANSGVITIAAGKTFQFWGNSTQFNLAAGTIGGPGRLQLYRINANLTSDISTGVTTFELIDSKINGPGTTLTNVTSLELLNSTIGTGLVNQGTMVAIGISAVNGPLTTLSSSVIRMQGGVPGYGTGTLTVANGFTNLGAIELTDIDFAAGAKLNVTAGTLVNDATATITGLEGAGGSGTLAAELNNQGKLILGRSLNLGRASAKHVNTGIIDVNVGTLTVTQSGTTPSFSTSGTISIASGNTLKVNGGAFNVTAGSVGGDGTLSFINATANTTPDFTNPATTLLLNNSTFNGPGTLTNAKSLELTFSTINATLINQGTLLAKGGNSAMIGPVTTTAMSIIRAQGDDSNGPATLTVANGFTNLGLIELTAIDSPIGATLTVTAGTIVNAAGATITGLQGTGGARMINSNVDNQGTIQSGIGTLTIAGANTQSGAGKINVPSGTTLITTGSGKFEQAAGTITVDGTLDPAGDLTLAGGTLFGVGTVKANVFNTGGTVSPGASLGLLTIDGNYTQSAGGTLRIELNGPPAGTLHDTLIVNGKVALDGSINASLGFAAPIGDSFVIIDNDQADLVSGTFAGIANNAKVTINGVRFRVNYNTSGNDVTLTRLATGIDSLIVADNSVQRSIVRSFTVTFGGVVTFPTNAADAFTLLRIGSSTAVATSVDTSASTADNTIAKLTFSGAQTEFGSLIDGNYQLTVLGGQITDVAGQLLDGDNNGTAGGNNVTSTHRLFGDADGDRNVAANDFIAFRSSFGMASSIFDFDNDGAVAASDFIQFRLRFGGSI